MTMGLSELRQWVYLLSASNAENQMEEGAEEFLRMSFMRANFCSKLMNYAKGYADLQAGCLLNGDVFYPELSH